jgi:predicted Rossmann fold nucleotide-binding protein DprA/Smf involved in DNA uptake
MTLDENQQAILLLAAHFSAPGHGDPTPLTPMEYGRLSAWMLENQFEPKDMLSCFNDIRATWVDPKAKVTGDRLEFLLGRGVAMGIALEKWNSAGIWIITEADSGYPERLRRKLLKDAPPLFFGIGNQGLLNAGGLALVGSRKIDSADRDYSQRLAQAAANAGMNVVSGGAKGVDETSMLAALEVDGTALGILANSLLSAALSSKWRPYLRKNELCLVSPQYPEAPFHVGHAMGRNKYIYVLADHSVVVRAEKGEGGTWAGATEAIKKKLAPVFVKPTSDAEGNKALIGLGATALFAAATDVSDDAGWLMKALDGNEGNESAAATTSAESRRAEEAPAQDSEASLDKKIGQQNSSVKSESPDPANLFFEYFMVQLRSVLKREGEVTLKELKERHPDLTPKQVTDWLARAVEEGLIERPGRSQRYTAKGYRSLQNDLFQRE